MEHARQTTHEVLDASAIRAQHSRLILNLLWRQREISRAELARRTSLSRSTVSAIVTDLLGTGLVEETRAGVSSGGRRPIMLEFQDQASFIVGIELGATHLSCVLTDLRCTIKASWSAPAPVRDAPELALAKMTMGVRSVMEAGGVQPSQIIAIGVAVPSPVDEAHPGELLPLVVPTWQGYNIATHLEDNFKRPVFVDNDANLGALAELWWGAGSSSGDLAYIKVATGVGAGFIINGRIFRGSGGIAGEIGHTSIDPNGPQCVCGLKGCLTTFIGTPALLERAKNELRAAGLDRRPPASIDELVNAALDGDPMSVELILYAGDRLGIGIANMLNLLNPKTVVLGGGITRASELLLDAVRRTIHGLSLPASISHADIRTTGLSEWGIAVGAATLVLQVALDKPALFPNQSRDVG
jgi:predicted NBD/HSP70 family sugar kinase